MADPITPPVDPSGQPPADPKVETDPKTEKRFSQAELDAIIQDRLARAREAGEKEASKAAKAAEEAALTKNAEWQTLAEKRQAELEGLAKRIAELEPVQKQAESYKKALEGYVKSMTDKLPESIKALLESKDPVEQIEYLTKYGSSLGIKNGVPPTPNPDDGNLTPEQKADRRAAYERMVRQMKP